MSKPVQILLLVAVVALFALAGYFYLQSQQISRDIDTLRTLTTPQNDTGSEEETSQIADAEVATEGTNYDPSDLDQTPPGVTPFIGSSVCFVHWGNHLRQSTGFEPGGH